MFSKLTKRLFRSGDQTAKRTPTAKDFQVAREQLDKAIRPAVFGQLGGQRPPPNNAPDNWWGGNLWSLPDETLPVCAESGTQMVPFLQIRTNSLPHVPTALKDTALVTLWIDPNADGLFDAKNGTGFCLRTYNSLEGLCPISAASGSASPFPTFPVFWQSPLAEQPTWEDMVDHVSYDIACAKDDDWFCKSPHLSPAYEHARTTLPIKIGGWPDWIQSPDWPDEATFAFQIYSSDKGKFNYLDSGSLYLFQTPKGWVMRGDFF
ncbi:MAG: hypothetical protein JXR15_16520 [Shimia sp.]|uniref:hypothetical protein n=1 Tax=Shimia sp. TaxID=1954381 RepID=UPI003B8DC3BD